MTNVKLTLNVQDSVIVRAKRYASRHRISLSKLVERYLATLGEEEEEEREELPVSSWVSDIAVVKKSTPDFDHKSKYRKYITSKYSDK